MRLLYVLPLIPLAAAINCREILSEHADEALDPAAAAVLFWDIVPFENTFVRAQNYKDPLRGKGGRWTDACVEDLEYNATGDTVLGTMDDFDNLGGGNEKLWLQGGAYAAAYWGMKLFRGCSMEAQPYLNDPRTCISMILPSAIQSVNGAAPLLRAVGPSRLTTNAARVHAFGLDGTIRKTDYAYMAMASLEQGLNARFVSNNANRAYALATTSTEDHCVVVDLRTMVRWMSPGGTEWPRPPAKRAFHNFPKPQL